jgi:thioredoxin domain-containing protein 10
LQFESILNFFIGPTVQQVTRPESFEILKSNNPVFFVYIGQQLGHLWNIYAEIAEKNQAQVILIKKFDGE